MKDGRKLDNCKTEANGHRSDSGRGCAAEQAVQRSRGYAILKRYVTF
jgi:hypothetical protein